MHDHPANAPMQTKAMVLVAGLLAVLAAPPATPATAHEIWVEAASTGQDSQKREVRFPLIAGGPHVLLVKCMDETPGRYEGDLEFSTKFSHLRKGDAYERTLYISTLAFVVKPD